MIIFRICSCSHNKRDLRLMSYMSNHKASDNYKVNVELTITDLMDSANNSSKSVTPSPSTTSGSPGLTPMHTGGSLYITPSTTSGSNGVTQLPGISPATTGGSPRIINNINTSAAGINHGSPYITPSSTTSSSESNDDEVLNGHSRDVSYEPSVEIQMSTGTMKRKQLSWEKQKKNLMQIFLFFFLLFFFFWTKKTRCNFPFLSLSLWQFF